MAAATQTQQGARQASVRAVTGSAETYEGDFHRLFTMAGISAGSTNLLTGVFEPLSFDERLLLWINLKLSRTFTNLPEAMQAMATANGAYNWSSMGTFDAATSAAPVNTVAPAITGTSASVGVIFTTTNGTWDNTPLSYTYQWQADAADITGETFGTYTGMAAELGKLITCIVTATNAAGSTPATSNSIGPLVLPKTVEGGSAGTFTAHYSPGYSVVTQSGGKVVTATDLKAFANLVDDGAGHGPAIETDASGVPIWRFNQTNTLLKNISDLVADARGITVIAVVRFDRQIAGTNQCVMAQSTAANVTSTGGGLMVQGSSNVPPCIGAQGRSAQFEALSSARYRDFMVGCQKQVIGFVSRAGTGVAANTGCRLIVNEQSVNVNATAVTTTGIAGFEIGHSPQGAAAWFSGALYELIITVGTGTTDATADAQAANAMAAHGIIPLVNQLVYEGDSITDSTGTLTVGNTFGRWSTEPGLRTSLPRDWLVWNWGGASNQTTQLTTRRDGAGSGAQAAGLKTGGKNIWAVQIGVNDLSTGGKSATTCYNDIVTYAYTTAVSGAVGSILKKGWSYACMQNIGVNVTATNDKISVLSPNLRGLEAASFLTDCDANPGGVYAGKVAVIPLYLTEGSGAQRFNTQAQVAAGLTTWFVDTTHPTALGERTLAADPTYGYASIPDYFP